VPARVLALLLFLLLGAAACSAPVPVGEPQRADGARLVVPPGWEARLATTRAAGRNLIGWLANVPLDVSCDPATCARPLGGLGEGELLVWWFSYNCLPDCALPDAGRTLVGGREASREVDGDDCGIGARRRELISVRVTPQRTDTLVACSGDDAHAALDELESLIGSIRWTVP
jgi:hypothetical protein